MEIKLTHDRSIVPVTVMQLEGTLDGSNYEELIDTVQRLYESGTRNLLLDLSRLTFLSSAGMAAIHRAALLFNGKRGSDMEEGWAAFRAMERDREGGKQQHVKLLNPSQEVRRVLDTVGFSALFEMHDDLQKAVASFQ